MSSRLDDQVLHLALDAVATVDGVSVVVDDSGHGRSGTLAGTAAAETDTLFGTAVWFDEGYADVELGSALSGGALTLTAWIKPGSLNGTASTEGVPNVFLAQTCSGGDVLQAGVGTEGSLYLSLGGDSARKAGTGQVTIGSWHFVAVIVSDGAATVYLDELDPVALGDVSLASGSGHHLTVGGLAESGEAGLDGAMRHVRAWNVALSADELRAIRNVDLTTAVAPSRTSVLLDFAVEDSRGQPALYIVDESSRETTTLRIKNTSSRTLSLPGLAEGELDGDHAPLAVQFRPGVLDATCFPGEGSPGIEVNATGWQWILEEQEDGSALLLLAPEDETTIGAGKDLTFEVTGLVAAALGGARGTRAMLSFQHVGFPLEDGGSAESAATLSGSRQVYLHVVNQSGKRHTPLVLAFVGSNAVINDGVSENEFTLSILNPTSQKVALSTDADSPTRFVFAIPVSTSTDEEASDDVGALCTSGQAESISVDANGWTVEVGLSAPGRWTLTPGDDVASIPANDSVSFRFTGLVTSMPSGRTLVGMHYQNLPGYWDGYLTASIEKAPMRYEGSSVGIGAAQPAQTLHVRASSDAADGIAVENAGKGAPQVVFMEGGEERFGVVNDATGLLFHDYDKKMTRLTIDAQGNVGIGKTPDGFMLDVQGHLRVGAGGDGGRIWTGYEDVSPALYLYDLDDPCLIRFRNGGTETAPTAEAVLAGLNGNIGIGTLAPESTLEVAGDLTVQEDATIAGALEVVGAAALKTLSVGEDATLAKALSVSGAATLASANVTNALKVGGAVTVSKDLTVSGAATLASLLVNGSVNLSGRLGTLIADSGGRCCWTIGDIMIQWGLSSSTLDESETFSFPSPFRYMCTTVVTSLHCSGGKTPLHPSSWSKSSFTVDRHDDHKGTVAFSWIAIGF